MQKVLSFNFFNFLNFFNSPQNKRLWQTIIVT